MREFYRIIFFLTYKGKQIKNRKHKFAEIHSCTHTHTLIKYKQRGTKKRASITVLFDFYFC